MIYVNLRILVEQTFKLSSTSLEVLIVVILTHNEHHSASPRICERVTQVWKHAFSLREEIPQIKGKKVQFYIKRLAEVRKEVLERISDLTDSHLGHLVELDHAAVSIEWILYHIIEHEAIHIGQISMLKRLYQMNA